VRDRLQLFWFLKHYYDYILIKILLYNQTVTINNNEKILKQIRFLLLPVTSAK